MNMEEEKKEVNETDVNYRMAYKVYDLPVGVWSGLCSYARVHYEGGQVAKAITEAFELLMEREKDLHEAIPTKLIELEARVAELEKPKDETKKRIKTLGGIEA
jgi:hypothetical protein